MTITESKAVALDAAVCVLLDLYDISVTHIRPLRWLRKDIKKVYASGTIASFEIEFWIHRDPAHALTIVVDVYKDPIPSWQPTAAHTSTYKDGFRHDHHWTFPTGSAKPVMEQ
jgi:hypothetical protein